MKSNQILFTFFISSILLISACEDSSTGVEELQSDVEIQEIQDLNADGDNEHYTFFNLRTGQEVQHADSVSTDWDIAFRGTTVIFNGGVNGPGEAGALDLDVAFEQVGIAPSDGYRTDSDEELAIPTGSGNGWYTYTGQGNPPHAILPIEEYTIIVKTADGNHYAKVEMISYYLGNPDTSSDEFINGSSDERGSGHYTFRYAIQQTEGLRELQ